MTAADGTELTEGMRVTGVRVGGERRQQLVIKHFTIVADDLVLVSCLVPYASTFTEGGTYEGSYRGTTTVDLSSIQAV